MANLMNTLYPPQIPTYQPAFLTTESCKVYFSLSQYNSYKEIKNNAQVTISNQNTNQSVLSLNKYNNEIKLCQVKVDKTKNSDNYYIEIEPEDLQNGFEINQYYKIQIRFTSIYAPDPPSSALDKWLIDNIDYFSEWSTVCLIRAISPPSLQIQNFPSNNDIVISTSSLNIIGTLTFADPSESDSLNYYQIKLFDENQELLMDSNIVYTNDYNNPNTINYSLKYKLQNGFEYSLQIDITTKNYYYNTYIYNFAVLYSSINPIDAIITAQNDKENGRIKITLSNTTTDKYQGKIIIKRASSKDNFITWENIHIINFINPSLINIVWNDCTVESGTWYKYSVQKEDSFGNLGAVVEIDKPILAIFEDMFLNANGKQLKIRYDQNVSSLKQNIAESKSETLGSKYPFIFRNGYINYRSMSISGLITFLNDENEEFLSQKEIYQDSYDLYKEYNDKNRITDFNNFLFEKQFREEAIKFLYEDNIKLLRTLTEGNTLVKLMNISLSPKANLGRYIYSFSAEAYEIDSCSIDNYFNYSIINKQENYDDNENIKENLVEEERLGQIQGDIKSGENIINAIKEKYSNYLRIKDIRIQFEEDPYPIGEDTSGNLIISEKNPIGIGYIFYLDNSPIMVSKKGIYQLKDLNIGIDSISFIKDTKVTIDYLVAIEIAQTEEESNEKNIYISTYYSNIIGQLWGSFEYNKSLYNDIYEKYNYKYSSYKTRLAYIGSIQIESNCNSVFYIQTDTASIPGRYVINDTNLLTLQDKELEVIDIQAGGIHLDKTINSNLELVSSNLYFEEEGIFTSLESIGYPEDNHVYNVENQRYIWYNKKWEKINENDDIEIAIDGIINYSCKIIREVYLNQ